MRRRRQFIVLTGALLLAACVTEEPTHHGGLDDSAVYYGMNGPRQGLPENAPRLAEDPTMDWLDPCAANLQELMGALLLYYRTHAVLPTTLEQLPATSPSGDKLNFSCPKSGKRYLYYPQGYRAPDMLGPVEYRPDGSPKERNRLILYDAAASHEMVLHLTDGKKLWQEKQMVRFGIVMEPLEPGRPAKMYVVPLQQAMLDMYIKGQVP